MGGGDSHRGRGVIFFPPFFFPYGMSWKGFRDYHGRTRIRLMSDTSFSFHRVVYLILIIWLPLILYPAAFRITAPSTECKPKQAVGIISCRVRRRSPLLGPLALSPFSVPHKSETQSFNPFDVPTRGSVAPLREWCAPLDSVSATGHKLMLRTCGLQFPLKLCICNLKCPFAFGMGICWLCR